MLSLSPSSTAPSSLELMLENLWRKEEEEKHELLPALPTRPRPISKSRRPLAKRPVPQQLDTSDASRESSTRQNACSNIEGGSRLRAGRFGAKTKRVELEDESPYSTVPNRKNNGQRLEEGTSSSTQSGTVSTFHEYVWDDKISYFIKEKLHVWCRLQNGHWKPGHIQSVSGEKASILLLDGSNLTVSIEELLPANPDLLKGADDLVQLIYLNEPSVLHNLQYRYSRDIFHSKAGPVLIAINPFEDVEICGNDIITAYRKKLVDTPHVYAVADNAYTEMMRDEVDQSIIISGESGAGKTQTAKVALQYLAALGGSNSEIECGILQISCILEAFGNAKTSRNDNASRLGSLIEIQFSGSGEMCGAKIETFLLEKSRVVQRARGERSFHIFYQLCAGAPPRLKDKLNLKRVHEYNYLNQSSCEKIDGVDDAEKFHMLMGALNAAGICKHDQELSLEMLAAVLWLGNISFQVIDPENHVKVMVDEAVSNTSNLLGCNVQDLVLFLSTHEFQSGKDKVTEALIMQQAVDRRDALAKFIYANLFDWLVVALNKSLETSEPFTGRSISILDICGFELLQNNSFEQLCINYANERLHQHFLRHLLKLEQEAYEFDGIDWTKVDFEDNQECLDLFEKKTVGLISLLDEELNIPEATNLTFAARLKQNLNANPRFKGERSGAFSIHHCIGEVQYDMMGLLEKNRDFIYWDAIQFFSSCSRPLPQLFASDMHNQLPKRPNSSSHLDSVDPQRKGVASEFKMRLFKLIQQLDNTKTHFIVCVKPNNKRLPGRYEANHVLDQLRWSGLLEVVRIARSGYPIRMTHKTFVRRYGFMLLENNVNQDPLSISIAVLKQFHILPELYRVGFTKLYFRVNQVDILENMRKQALQGKLELQTCFHHHLSHCNLHELKRAVTTMQSFVRGENARREVNVLKNLRQHVSCENCEAEKTAAVQIQSVIRWWLAQKHFKYLQNLNRSRQDNPNSKQEGRRVSDAKDLLQKPTQFLPSVMDDLQRQVLMAEATLLRKEGENAALRRQVQQFELQFSEYEAKKKSAEEIWEKQMASLQMSLAAANKSLAANSSSSQHGRLCGSPLARHYGCEDSMSLGTQTGGSTPIKFSDVLDIDVGRAANGSFNPVSRLDKEFEHLKQNFNDEAKALIEVKSGQPPSTDPAEEFRRLKHKFKVWKKDYKVRLREVKSKLQRNGYSEVEKGLRKWWGKKSNLL